MVATGRTSPKARHVEKNPKVGLFYQVGPEFIHTTVTGGACFIDDPKENERVWNEEAERPAQKTILISSRRSFCVRS